MWALYLLYGSVPGTRPFSAAHEKISPQTHVLRIPTLQVFHNHVPHKSSPAVVMWNIRESPCFYKLFMVVISHVPLAPVLARQALTGEAGRRV